MGRRVHPLVKEKSFARASKSSMTVKQDSKPKKDYRLTHTNLVTFIVIYIIVLKIR